MPSERFLRSIAKIQRPEEASRFLRLDMYWHPKVAEALLTQVDTIVAMKPRQALGLAEIAVDLVKRIEPASSDLRAHAFCSLATAQRWLDRLNEAEANYRRAEEIAPDLSPKVSAMIHRQKAMLFVERGDLDRALALATRAVEIDQAAGIIPGKSLIIKGIVLGFRKDTDKSASCFKRVLEIDNPEGDEYLFATNNLIASIMQRPLLAAEIVEARKTLRTIQDRIRGIRETPVRYYVWGVEGRLHASLAEFRQAANHFSQSRSGFLRLGMIADYARASTDLVETLTKKGDLEKARIVIERTASQIAELEGNERFAEAFRLALDQPIEKAADVIRSQVDGVCPALPATLPPRA